MEIVQFVHEGLGNSSYLVQTGESLCVVVDPDRSVRRYLEAASGRGLSIAGVLETHIHADFITGAREIAAATGAQVYNPMGDEVRYDHRAIGAGEAIDLGGAVAEVLASPGHTPEHVAFVVRRPGLEPVLFSGGSVIVGGAARTDLLSPELTEPLTRLQYRTLRTAFEHLSDETPVYPTHGGGSFCSAGAGSARVSTLGDERRMNVAMGKMSEEEFVEWFPSSFPGVPKYYAHMRDMNMAGPRLRGEVMTPRPLSPGEFKAAAQEGLIVDLRSPADYFAAHVRGSLSNPFRDVFPVWLGWLVPLGTPLLFILDGTGIAPVIDECLLVGHETIAGYLDGGIMAWDKAGFELVQSATLSAEEARRAILDGATVLDVREPDEFAAGHIEGALAVPLGSLEENAGRVPRDRPVLAYCGAGQRSASAVSILERAGISPVMNLRGGFTEWEESGERVERG
jgi:glyoxylase-like metal-dependent hydrolase (beta-lactamase superfamily II)/rhodanese-related sulfurtransferase